MTDTVQGEEIRKARAISLDELRALANKFPTVKVDVVYRVNPSGSPVWGGDGVRRDFWANKPTPAVYYLSASGSWDSPTKAFRESYGAIVYLAPVVGKLLRDAGYLVVSTRARSLARTVQDLEAEVKKYLPEQLAEIDAAEAARMAKAARVDAAKQITGQALGLKTRLESLGNVAGLGTYGLAWDIVDDLKKLVEFLATEIPAAEKPEAE